MKTTILWDHDGVLVDTEAWYFEATRRCVAPLGVNLTLARYLADMPTGGTAWEQAAAAGADANAIAQQKTARNALYQQFLREQPIDIAGVPEVLSNLARSYRMAIVTTAKREDFDLIHRDRQIACHMELILTNGDYPRPKPHPDPYLTALEQLGVKAQESVVVEDSERGLRSAMAAGIDCVVVANRFVATQDFTGAVHQIESLAQLPAWLAAQ